MTPDETLRLALLEDRFPEDVETDRLFTPSGEDKLRMNRNIALSAWMSRTTGRDINAGSITWQADKDAIAQGFFKIPTAQKMSDDQFHSLVKSHVQTADNASDLAARYALQGKGLVEAMAELNAKRGPSQVRGIWDKYATDLARKHTTLTNRLAPYRPLIQQVSKELSKEMEWSVPTTDAFQRVADKLMAVPEADRRLVLSAVGATGGMDAKERSSYLSKLAGAMGRMTETMGSAVASSVAEAAMPGTIADLVEAGQMEMAGRMEKESERQRQMTILTQQIRSVADQEISPIKEDGWWKGLGIDLARMIPQSAVSVANPALGFGANWAYFKDTIAAQAMMEEPGLTVEQADGIANATAPLNAAVETVTALIPFGKVRLPFLQKWIQSTTTSLGGAARNLAIRSSAATASEIGEEWMQSYLPLKAQELAAALSQDVPGVDWEKRMPKFSEIAAQTWGPALVFSLVGGGAASISEVRNGRDLAQDIDGMVATGIAPEMATKIAEAAKANDWQSTDALFRDEFISQNKATEEEKKSAFVRFQQKQEELRKSQARDSAEAEAIGVSVIRDAEGWKVRMSDGSIIPADSAEAATRMQKDMAMAASEYEAETMVAAVDEMLAQQPGRRFEVTAEVAQAGDNGLVFTNPITGQVREIKDEASLQNLRDEQMALAKKEGEEPAAALILGMNRFEFGNGIISVFQRGLNKDGTADVPRVFTAMHEQIEASFRKGIVTGVFTDQGARSAIGALMSQLDIKRLGKSATDQEKAWFERAATVARGEGDENLLREVVSEMASRTWIGRDKVAEKTGLRPGTILRALDAAVLKAKQPAEMSMMKRIRAWIKAVGAYLRGVVATAKLISQAEQAGTVTDYTEFMDKLLGLTESRREDMAQVEQMKQQMEDDGMAFSLSPTTSADQLAEVIESIMQARPDLAFRIRQRSLADINRLIQNWSTDRVTWKGDKIRPVVEKRTKASLDKEQAMREAVRYSELLDSGMATLTPETLMAWSEGVGKLEQHPLIKQMLGAHGRLMSKPTAERLGKLKTDGKGNAGDYDGATWMPPQWYAKSGSGIMPDVMAQNLYDDGFLNEPTTDVLWQALGSVITTQRTAKAEYAKSEEAVKGVEKQAKEKAKAEAAAWREETEDMMADDWSPRESIQRDARLFNTAMAAFPAEIRAKIVPGGMVKMAGQATERARYKTIEKAMQKAVVELEKFMRKEQLAEVVKLLDKAVPVGKPGEVKKSKFIVTVQDELDTIADVVSMDADEVEVSMTESEALLIAATTPEQADSALSRLHLLETFGGILDIKNTTSQELDSARQYLENLMKQGREARKVLDEERREQLKQMVQTASKDAFKGDAGPDTTQAARAKAAKQSGKTMLKKFFNELGGFDGVLRDVFGPKSETATKFSERFVLNSNAFEDTQNERRKRLRDFARDLYRTRLGAVINQKLIKLEDVKANTGVTFLKGREVKTHKFTLDDAAKIVADPKAFGFTDKDAQEISDEIQAIQDAGGRRKSFTFEQVESEGDRVEIPLSQMQAVYLSMALRQPGILEQQQRHGYDQTTVDELEAFLSDDAKRWREWMQSEYDAEYARANEVYMRMFNTRMPRIQFYAPLLKNHQGNQAVLDPLNTGTVAQSANPGSLKTRKARTSSLRIESALSVFWSHFNQMDYWVTNAEYLRDVQAVMLNPQVRDSVVSSHGDEGMQTLSSWVNLQMARGVGKAALIHAGNRMFRNVKSAVSMKALALNLSTTLKTLPSALYSLGEIHLSKWPDALASGIQHWARLWKTGIIQRRLDIGGMPELRDLGSSALPMSWVNQAIKYGSYPTMYADGVFTTFSAAMAYGVNYDEAIKQGASEDAAHAYAEERTALIVSKTAQPENWTQKSLFENDASGAGALFFMFTSDPRQKAALAGEALNQWRKGSATTEESMRKFLAYWVLPGVMFQLANAIGRSMFKGDDDEWEVVDFATAAIVGQLQGLVLLGSTAEMIVSAAVAAAAEKLTGEEVSRKKFWSSPKNPLDQAADDLIKAAEKLDLEDGNMSLEQAWKISKAAGMLVTPYAPAGALPATAERVIKDTTNLFYRGDE